MLKRVPRLISGVHYWHSGHDRDFSWHFAREALDCDLRSLIESYTLITRTSAQKGQVVVVEKLLDTIREGTRQELLQLPNNVGNIALQLAPMKGQVEVVENLLDAIRDVGTRLKFLLMKEQFGCTALHVAAKKGPNCGR